MKIYLQFIATAFICCFTTRLVAQTPSITTIIGTGTIGSNTLGVGANGNGLGNQIYLNTPGPTICSDAAGNLYFFDRNTAYVRKWTRATKMVTTIAGNGTLVAPPFNFNQGSCNDDGSQATSISVTGTELAVTKDGRYLYIANAPYELIRYVDLNTGIIGTLVGQNGGSGAYCRPAAIGDSGQAKFAIVHADNMAVDNSNNLYILGNNNVRKITVSAGQTYVSPTSTITSIIQGYPTGTDEFDGPTGAYIPNVGAPGNCGAVNGYGYLNWSNLNGTNAFCISGNMLYLREAHYSGVNTITIRQFNLSTNTFLTTPNSLKNITLPGLTVNVSSSFCRDGAGNFYLSCYTGGYVYKITPTGQVSVFAGDINNNSYPSPPYNNYSPITNINLGFDNAIIDGIGNMIICDAGRHVIHQIPLCPIPLDPIGGNNTVCSGDSIVLSNNTLGGTWESTIPARATVNANGVVKGFNAGQVTIRYYAPGCNNFVSKTITVFALPPVPTIRYTPGSANPQAGAPAGRNICNNRTFSVDALIPISSLYISFPQWTVNNLSQINAIINPIGIPVIATATLISNVANGPAGFTFAYTDNRTGCSIANKTYETGWNVVACMPRQTNNQQSEIKNTNFNLYPNPAKNYVNILFDNQLGTGKIIITDLYGKQIKQQTVLIGTNTIDVSNVAKGIYFVSVITDQGKETKKLIIE